MSTTTDGIAVGTAAPDFELRDQNGTPVRLSSFRGRQPVVLMFYPWAFSRVCTSELCDVRDRQAELTVGGAAVLAVSCDPMFSLRAYAEAERLTFPLLSDFWPHGGVARTYGVFDEERGCARRSSYVVDRDGVVRWAVHNAIPDARDLDEQLAVLRDLGGLGAGGPDQP